MSYVTLQQVKDALRQTHSEDDTLLQRLIDAAESECLRFLGRTELPTLPLEYPVDSDGDLVSSEVETPSSEDPVAPDVVNGIIMIVIGDYDGNPTERDKMRRTAEQMWIPYRIGMGV
jgi:hypothetical protein